MTSFDSIEQMYAAMNEAETKANAALLPDQRAIRDATNDRVYWFRPAPEYGCVIFGDTSSLADLLAKERRYLPALDFSDGQCDLDPEKAQERAEARSEWSYTEIEVPRRRTRGYLTGDCYSVIEPSGEWGDTHVANVWRLSAEGFAEAREANWAPDPAQCPFFAAAILKNFGFC